MRVRPGRTKPHGPSRKFRFNLIGICCRDLPRGAGGVMAAELDKDTITKAYARWAPVYDVVFGAVFDRGRRAAIAAAEQVGGRILEVGVGTGISLPDYSR